MPEIRRRTSLFGARCGALCLDNGCRSGSDYSMTSCLRPSDSGALCGSAVGSDFHQGGPCPIRWAPFGAAISPSMSLIYGIVIFIT